MKFRILAVLCVLLWAGTAVAQFFPFPGPGRAAVGGGGGCTEATNYLARKSGTTNNAGLTTYICGLVSAGLFAKLDAVWYYGNDTLANSQLNLIQNAYNITTFLGTQTPGASGAGGFSSCCGDIADGGFNPSTAVSPKFVRDSGTMFVWSNDASAQTSPIAGSNGGGSAYIYANSGGVAYYAINGGSFCAGTVSDGAGFYVASRTTSTLTTEYKNGTSLSTCGTTSSAVPNINLVFGAGDGGTSVTSQYIIGGIGSGLNATDVTNLYNLTHAFLQTVAGYP